MLISWSYWLKILFIIVVKLSRKSLDDERLFLLTVWVPSTYRYRKESITVLLILYRRQTFGCSGLSVYQRHQLRTIPKASKEIDFVLSDIIEDWTNNIAILWSNHKATMMFGLNFCCPVWCQKISFYIKTLSRFNIFSPTLLFPRS